MKIARLESGTVQMERRRVNVRQAAEKAWEPLAIPAELKSIAIKIDAEGNPCFQGDLAWTVEALGNILKNCVEYLPAGGRIEITAVQNPIYTELCIADNGPGIPQEELPHLFERFYRGAGAEAVPGEDLSGADTASEARVDEHAGIGLALAQMIIREQNGIIQAENRREGGTEFQIRFYQKAK